MNFSEFEKAAKDCLIDVYGAKYFPPGVMRVIWDIVQPLSAGHWRFAMKGLLEAEGGKVPTPATIRRVCLPALNAAAAEDKSRRIAEMIATGKQCPYCGNSGWCEAIKRGNYNPLYTFAFHCSYCPSAEVLELGKGGVKRAVVWDESVHKEAYALIPQTEKALEWLRERREWWQKTQGNRIEGKPVQTPSEPASP